MIKTIFVVPFMGQSALYLEGELPAFPEVGMEITGLPGLNEPFTVDTTRWDVRKKVLTAVGGEFRCPYYVHDVDDPEGMKLRQVGWSPELPGRSEE